MDVFPSEGVKECRRTSICSVGIHYKERMYVPPYPVGIFALFVPYVGKRFIQFPKRRLLRPKTVDNVKLRIITYL